MKNTLKLWIARDKDGAIYAHRTRPKNRSGVFFSDHYMYLGQTKFPSVTFENSPQQVELKLKEK